MKLSRLFSGICSLGILTGCTAVIFGHETSSQQALLELSRPSNSVSVVLNAPGSDPDVSFDGQKVAFIQEDTGGVRQIFVMTIGQPSSVQQITTGSSRKRVPRWSTQGKLAFASGTDIVILNSDLSPFNLGSTPPQANGGLDFYYDGDKLVYQRDNNLYTVPIDRSTPEQQITACNTPPTICSWPVISHDQSKLAYHTTIMLAAGWLEFITILEATTWNHHVAISMGPALGGGGKIDSYDFSPNDEQMYVAAKPFDQTTSTYGTEHELFVVNLDGTDKKILPPGPAVRGLSTYQWFP